MAWQLVENVLKFRLRVCVGSEVAEGPVTSMQKRKSVFAQRCIRGCGGDGRNVDSRRWERRQTEESGS